MNSKLKKELIEWGKALGFALVVAALVMVFARPSFVLGSSMLPTFLEGDLVLVESVSQFFGEPKYGDIVVAESNLKLDDNTNKNIIKRVIALPGQSILVKSGKVYVDGVEIDEPYLNNGSTNGSFEGVVPDKHLFLMGDNRFYSRDSRSDEVGFVPYDRLRGKVYFRIWPLNRIKLF